MKIWQVTCNFDNWSDRAVLCQSLSSAMAKADRLAKKRFGGRCYPARWRDDGAMDCWENRVIENEEVTSATFRIWELKV